MTKNAKKVVLSLLKDLPEHSSLEDIQHTIYIHEKIERGLQDVKMNRVLSQKTIEKRINRWLGR